MSAEELKTKNRTNPYPSTQKKRVHISEPSDGVIHSSHIDELLQGEMMGPGCKTGAVVSQHK